MTLKIYHPIWICFFILTSIQLTCYSTNVFGTNGSFLGQSDKLYKQYAAKYPNIQNVREFGETGTNDDTKVVQAALDSAQSRIIYFPAGIYNVLPLKVNSNTHLILHENAILKAVKGYKNGDSLINIISVNNVSIDGNNALIQMLKKEYTSGEQRHGLRILSSDNIKINNLRSVDSGGDGFYIGSVDDITPSSNISLTNCKSTNNRRQGLSIVSAKNLLVENCFFSETSGTAPAFGIDIEPNSSNDTLTNILIRDVSTEKNSKGGIQFALRAYGQTKSKEISIRIENWQSKNDGENGALRFAYSPQFPLVGFVKINNVTIENPVGRGIDFFSMNENLPSITLSDFKILNPSFSMDNPGNIDKSALSFHGQFNTKSINTPIVKLIKFEIQDNRKPPIMYSGIYFRLNSVDPNISLEDVTIKNAVIRNITTTLISTNK